MADDMHYIKVTEEDIEWANSQDRWACAIVRAIQRQRPAAKFVRVDAETIAYSERGHRYTFDTPKAAVEKVIRPFDLGLPVEPVTLRLNTAPTIRPVGHLTDEKKEQLRHVERERTAKEKADKKQGAKPRTHNRFCEIPVGADEPLASDEALAALRAKLSGE